MKSEAVKTVLMCAVVIGLAACSSGGDGGGGAPPAASVSPVDGVFMDSPVNGLRYETYSNGEVTGTGTTQRDATTDVHGTFKYRPGETVGFFIGKLAIGAGPVAAAPQITAWTVFGPNTSPTDQQVINLTRLLLSLDSDGVQGGQTITLGPQVNNASGSVNLNQSPASFSNDPSVIAFLQDAGAGPLVTEQTAVTHLGSGQFAHIGTWSDPQNPSTSQTQLSVVTLLPNGTYIIFSQDPTIPGGGGMERGNIFHNWQTGSFTWNILTNTDGEAGLSHTVAPGTLQVSGNTLSATFPNDPLPGPYTHFRVIDPAPTPNPIVGSWLVTNGTSGALTVITFFPDGTVTLVEDNDPALSPGGQDGIERGTYTFNPTTGILSGLISLDTNGQWGIHAGSSVPNQWGPFTVAFASPDVANVAVPGEPTTTLARIKAP
jgi:hypothetical protein